LQGNEIDAEEITGQDAGCLGAHKVLPGLGRLPRNTIDARPWLRQVGGSTRQYGAPPGAPADRATGLAGMHDVDDYPHPQTLPGLVIDGYHAVVSFADVCDCAARPCFAEQESAAFPDHPVRWFVLPAQVDVSDVDGLRRVSTDSPLGRPPRPGRG
jgi:hypothetical protein